MQTPSSKRVWLTVMLLWLAVSLACVVGAPEPVFTTPTQVVPTADNRQTGFTRQNPYDLNQVAVSPNWEVSVMEVQRSEQAWNAVHAASAKNDPAPQGWEFILLKVHVKSTYADDSPHNINSCDFAITGENLVMYTCGTSSIIAPEPRLNANLTSGTEAKGWVAYLIRTGEKDLMMVVNEAYNPDKAKRRFIAIDPGASIAGEEDLSGIKPTHTGENPDNPAQLRQPMVTENWVYTVNQVVRSDQAAALVADANPYNPPPADGMEFLLVELQVRYIGGQNSTGSIDTSFFHTRGSGGEVFNPPLAVAPYPRLDVYLFTGATFEGWVVLQIPKGETGVVLVIEPFLDLTTANQRYVALFPD